MERNGFVFYRSFYEALCALDPETRLACYDALMNYGLNGVEPEVEGVIKAIFISFKPQIDANNRRYANGCKGGKPKSNQDETKTKPSANQNITKVEPKEKDKDKDKDKEKVKDKEKDKDKYGKNVTLTIDEYQKLVRRWVIDAVRDRRKKKPPTGSIDDFFRQRIGNE